jgi:hypothetical protein
VLTFQQLAETPTTQRLPNNQSRCRIMLPNNARLRRLLPRLPTKPQQFLLREQRPRVSFASPQGAEDNPSIRDSGTAKVDRHLEPRLGSGANDAMILERAWLRQRFLRLMNVVAPSVSIIRKRQL